MEWKMNVCNMQKYINRLYFWKKLMRMGGKPPAVPMSHESFSLSGLTDLLWILNILGVDRMPIPINHFKVFIAKCTDTEKCVLILSC